MPLRSHSLARGKARVLFATHTGGLVAGKALCAGSVLVQAANIAVWFQSGTYYCAWVFVVCCLLVSLTLRANG